MHTSSRSSSPVRGLLAALLFSVLAGCAAYSGSGLKPGIATQNDVRATMGQPYATHKAAPGAGYAESWEYPHGPMGRHTFMARFDEQGRLLRIDQVLTPQTLAAIRYGSDDMEAVRSLLGRPGLITGPNRLYGGPIWDYYAFSGERKIILSVSFNTQGKAAAAGEAPDPAEFSPNDGANN